jgi:hypothetical protein
MIIYQDFLNPGAELCSDALPSTLIADGSVLAIESKKVQVGGEEINTGANKSKEEEEEGVEDENKTVINLVDSHSLVQTTLEKKTFISLQTAYWKQLLAAINTKKNKLLWGSDEKAPPQTTPEQKEEYKKLETAAAAKLKGLAKTEYDAVVARFASFKKNFPALQKFVKDEILANFSEFDFYTAAEPVTVGSCMIVPARYIGEAPAPTFYFYMDGLHGEKA